MGIIFCSILRIFFAIVAAVEILADVIRNSSFTQESIDKERVGILKDLEVM